VHPAPVGQRADKLGPMRTAPRAAVAAVALLTLAACVRTRDQDLGRALLGGNWQEARDLVRDGASIDAPQSVRFGEPVLARLATLPSAEGVKVALELGANPNRGDYIGRTPIMFAAANNRLETMRLLIAAGADVDAEAAGGRSAIGAAKHAEAREAVALLLASGAHDLEARRLFP